MGRISNFVPVVALLLAGCGQSGGFTGSPPTVVADSCSVNAQKQFVLDAMRDVYFWNDLLPETVDLDQYATPEALLADLISVQPLDKFSFIDLLAADTQFFAEGQFQGFGFRSRFEAADDLRLLQVFAESPAANAGLERGQRILQLNGRTITDIQANEGVAAVFDLPVLEFTMRRLDGSEFVANIEIDLVTINPIPQSRVINLPGGTAIGYLELATFVGTADDMFATVFADFAAAGVADVIIDLRYNGGGRVDTTELLGDYLGGVANAAEVFSFTRFNDNNMLSNRSAFFSIPGNSVNLSRLVVIASDRTASASELLTNSMFPYADVSLVGSTTLGKPVGQLGLQFCDKILRPTAFETLNANNQGRYFDGLPADCPVQDDLTIPVGDALDPNLVTALHVLETGSCPATAQSQSAQLKSTLPQGQNDVAGRPAWRRVAGAW